MLPLQKKILIAGYYGFKNTGDDAILSVMLSSLRAIRPGLDFVVVSGNPAETATQHSVQSILWTDLQSVLEAVRRCDLVILGGGGLFMDYWGVDPSTLLTKYHSDNSFYSGFPLLAKLNDKPCMIYSVGVGPLFSESGKALTRMAFELADVVTVRDNESRKLAESIGIESDTIQVLVDPAFGLPSDQLKADEALTGARVPRDMPLIGVCLRNWDISVPEVAWQQQVAAALDRFIETQNVFVLFVPFQVLPEQEKTNDLLVARRVMGMMRNASAASLLQDICSPGDIAGILAQCDLVVGMRLHSLIFSLKEAVPSVGIVYDPKIKSTMIRAGVGEYAIELSTLTSEKLYDAMHCAWVNATQIRTELKGGMDELKRVAKESAKLVIQLLDGPPVSKLKPAAVTYMKELALKQIQRLTEKEDLIESLTQSVQELSIEKTGTQQTLDIISGQLAEKEDLIGSLTQSVQELSIEGTQKQRTLDLISTQLAEKEELIGSLTQSVQALSIEDTRKQRTLDLISVHLAVKEAELNKIRRSLGWRLLSRYGRIKYRYLLPIYRLLRLAPKQTETAEVEQSAQDAQH
jgi:polysaccharide pyruvyl transferase CsaB